MRLSNRRVALAFAAASLLATASTRAADVTIDPATGYQTIDGFGSCLAWWVNDPSQSIYYNAAFRNLYARDLGFNMLRVEMHPAVLMGSGGNLGSSVDLVDDVNSNVSKFNFARREAAVYGDLAAWLRDNVLEAGSFRLVGAFWTPPHWLKGPTGTTYYTGDAAPWLQGSSNTAGGRLKQDAASKAQFARYAAAWIRGFEQRFGVTFVGVSLQNELIFETGYNSATYWKNEAGQNDQYWQYADMLRAVSDYFNAKGLNVKLMGPHHSHIAGRPGNPWHFGIQMAFIDAVRNHGSGNLMNELDIIASNDYVDEGLQNHAVMLRGYWEGRSRTQVSWSGGSEGNVSQFGKPNWFQETSGEGTNWDKDNALGLALKVQNALVQGHASAYIYWQTADDATDANAHILLGRNQVSNPHSSKKYCSMKHFSRYIRPGSRRVKATFDQSGWASYGGANEDDTYNSLNVSAYVKGGNLTVVLVNMRGASDTTNVKIPSSLGITSLQQWRTTASESFAAQGNLSVSNGRVSVNVPALSVVTLYGSGGGSVTPEPPPPTPIAQSLTVTKAGSGSGTVSSSPAGISCGGTCSATFANNTAVTLSASPASGSAFAGWGGACSGTGSCTVTMSAGRTVSATFNVSSGSGAATYGNNGNPWGIGPSRRRIEAENYDTGGASAGYHDDSPGNSGGQYRSDDVDIEASAAGGYDVGWVGAGEWLQYTVEVATAGTYELSLRVARKPTGTAGVRLLFGGRDATGQLEVPSTGAWQSWVDLKKTVTLAAGRQALRLAAVGSEFNVDWIEVAAAGSTTVNPPSGGGQQTYGNGGNPWSVGGNAVRIQAENYDAGGEGVAYHDVDPGNTGGGGRAEAVDLEGCSEGGSNVGWVASGEWLEYTLDVGAAGNYDVSLRLARLPAGDSHLKLLFADADKTGDVAVPSTGGWQSWTTVTRTVSLGRGAQVLRVAMLGSEFNLNWIEIKPSGAVVGPTPAPTPTPLPPATGAALTLYGDALASDWSDWSWTASVNTAAGSPVKVGSKAITATLGAYGAVSLRKGTAQATSGYSALRFWVHGGSGSAKKLRVFTYSADGTGDGTRVEISAPANTWTEVNVPLVLLGNPPAIKRLAIQEGSGGAQPEIAVDELRLVQ